MRGFTNGRRAAALAVFVSVGMATTGALAQGVPPGCVSGDPGGAVAGAVLGGVAGALLGNAVSGRNKAPGTILGGVAGATAGAAIGGGGVRCPEGYIYRGPPPDEAPLPVAAEEGDFWYGAPPSVRERIVFLRHRIERLDRDGWLSPRESEGLRHRLSMIARQEYNIRTRYDGDLPPDARSQLLGELGDVAHKLRWKEYRAEHAEE